MGKIIKRKRRVGGELETVRVTLRKQEKRLGGEVFINQRGVGEEPKADKGENRAVVNRSQKEKETFIGTWTHGSQG